MCKGVITINGSDRKCGGWFFQLPRRRLEGKRAKAKGQRENMIFETLYGLKPLNSFMGFHFFLLKVTIWASSISNRKLPGFRYQRFLFGKNLTDSAIAK